jgi:hypothetical protein
MKSSRICRNNILCKIDYPHGHQKPNSLPGDWRASIDDPVVPAPWPDRLQWEPPDRRGRNSHGFFQFGWFCSHAGFQLPWKLNFDKFTDEDWEDVASLINGKFAFRSVYGIPRGGTKLARALDKYVTPGYPILIVDDMLTSSRSFVHARAALGNPEDVFGITVCARGEVPSWVWPILSVNEWAQSRATGLG